MFPVQNVRPAAPESSADRLRTRPPYLYGALLEIPRPSVRSHRPIHPRDTQVGNLSPQFLRSQVRVGWIWGGFRLTRCDFSCPLLDGNGRSIQRPQINWETIVDCVVRKESDVDKNSGGNRPEKSEFHPVPIQKREESRGG